MKVLIAGGGTAGHINPGIAIANYIKEKSRDAQILFVGTKNGLETKLVPHNGFELSLISVKGLRRKLSFDNIKTFVELFKGLLQARSLIKKFNPDIVIGTGGYVCFPVLFLASRMKIPTLIHEQNSFPGITNRLLSRFVDVVCFAFPEAKRYFKPSVKSVFTGNPIRKEILKIKREDARAQLSIGDAETLVVIFGGSRGAESINETVSKMLYNNLKNMKFKVIFATGEAQFGKYGRNLEKLNNNNIKVVPFIYNMDTVLSAADLAVCRAGAVTISELTALGVPSILIPSPYVTANHQEHNSRALEEQGAAVVIKEKDLSDEILYNQIENILSSKDKLIKMSENAKRIGVSNSTEKIYEVMAEMLQDK